MPNPLLGIIFHPAFPPEHLVKYAQRAEAAGFDQLWLWEDCFWVGALTSSAIVLTNTERIRFGIGIMPATVRNPLFVAMEITTLARLFPGRFIAGFGHGVDSWMKQIGAAPNSSMRALEETVSTVRALLQGENVTFDGEQVHFDKVQMKLTAPQVPPLFVGAMREKTLQLAGRLGDGTILTEMSSPAYVRWAREHIATGMAQSNRADNHVVVYVQAKIGKDSREIVRNVLASRLGWAGVHLQALGIADEAAALLRDHGVTEAARRMPDAWLDELSISGTPEQAEATIARLAEAGAGSIILQPLDGDPACLDEYIASLHL